VALVRVPDDHNHLALHMEVQTRVHVDKQADTKEVTLEEEVEVVVEEDDEVVVEEEEEDEKCQLLTLQNSST
jgi:hypothetical protein